ncbi:lactate racemase domain-containing protein [Oceanobacillus bengalensis]|uniref:lactate racemase domain-containing protein n=1 Tax=Oceanobacillus bengalensis TaxID=1435466 RepID=UPI00160285D9|nr:lactate racemase domain-containing protein [Oceanobacillus bengalensis]
MQLYEIEQTFKGEKVTDIKETVWAELQANKQLNTLPEQAEIAITAGSRGIENIVLILKEIVLYLKDKNYKPFIVPSMGSHGGATAEGQVEVLHHLGITEISMGVPIRSSMEVLHLGTTPDDLPVYMDKNAYEADGIIVINRVKAHTAFHGKVESGLSKMVTIGLGKQKGASFVHTQGANNMEHNIMEVSKYAIAHSPICMGLAIIENGYDQTAVIKGVTVKDWHKQEEALLKQSKDFMPSLPLSDLDVLVVEEMGKNYSGTGMDPNIIGRMRIEGVEEPTDINIARILVLDLSEPSHGNAQGIGLADFTTENFINKIDRKPTYMNAITSTFLRRVMFPMHYATEEEALEAAITSLGPEVNRDEIDLIQVPNTLHLSRLYISESALNKINKEKVDFKIIRKLELQFENGEFSNRLLAAH